MKKYYLLFLLLSAICLALLAIINFDFIKINKTISANDKNTISANYEKFGQPINYIQSAGFEMKNEIIMAINEIRPTAYDKNIKAGIISHHLPTALPLIAEFYKNLKLANDKIKTFIVIGPDHNEKCLFRIATANMDFNTPFGILEIDKKSNEIHQIQKVDNKCFIGEHSIGVQTIFIKYFYPEAKIIPIIISSAASDSELAGVLDSIKNMNDIFVMGSLDFSHYQKLTMAEVYDSESLSWIKKNQPGKFNLSHIDSPPTIKLILDYVKFNDLEPIILKRINSFAYTGQAENTTGYMSIFFK